MPDLRPQPRADGRDGAGLGRAASQAARGLHALRRNTRRGALANIEAHYDPGNEFFRPVLDETTSYSCAVFASQSESLESASLRKTDLACRKPDLAPSDHLLEIGTGWVALAIHAAQRYGCGVTTTTVSREQFLLARQRVREAGLSRRAEVILRDYRDVAGRYDNAVISEVHSMEGKGFGRQPSRSPCRSFKGITETFVRIRTCNRMTEERFDRCRDLRDPL